MKQGINFSSSIEASTLTFKFNSGEKYNFDFSIKQAIQRSISIQDDNPSFKVHLKQRKQLSSFIEAENPTS